MTKCPEMTVR